MIALVDADNRIACGKCRESLGHISLRRWWPPWPAHVVEEASRPFWRRTRDRGKEWKATLVERRGYAYLPGREGVGRGPLGVRVECPECLTRQAIDG